MILTLDYKPVFAAFNTPVGFELVEREPGSYMYKFTVWPIEYEVYFVAEGVVWGVSLFLRKVLGPYPELRDFLQRVLKQPITMEEIPSYISKIESRPVTNTNFGQEKQIFSTLFQVIGNFIQVENPHCLEIDSPNIKKFGVYQTLVRRYLPDWEVYAGDSGVGMIVCREEEEEV